MVPFDSIKARLTELGWGDDIARLPKSKSEEFFSHKLVNQPKDLTDRSQFLLSHFRMLSSESHTKQKPGKTFKPHLSSG